jgi:rhodanese-related sulfurtransferase
MTMFRSRILAFALVLLAAATLAVACTGDEPAKAGATPASITVQDAAQKMKAADKPLLVDVREPSEWDEVHIDGARLAPLGKVDSELADVDHNREILLVCRSGRRSAKAQQLLATKGFTKLTNVEGGMLAWEKAGLPVVRGTR